MTVMLDIVVASVFVGLLLLTVMNVNINLSEENYRGMVEYHTQTETIQLARIIEFDFYKIGYSIPAAARPAITIAESTHIKFKTNLGDVPGATDLVEYGIGDLVLNSKNPRDRMLFRVENVWKVYINYSVIQFTLSYYDSNDVRMTAPVTGAALHNINSVKVRLMLESPEPFDTTRAGGKQYANAMYQKLIYPRNL